MKLLALLLATFDVATAAEVEAVQSSGLASKMAFIRERMSKRMKDVNPERSTLASIEKNILSMAQSRKTNAADMTAFLKEIQELLDNTMKKNIMQRVNQTQSELNGAYLNLSSCTHPADLDYHNTLKSLSTAHDQCREEQNAVWMDYDATCILAKQIRENEIRALCNAFQTANFFPNPATTCSMDMGTKVPTIGNYLVDMAKFFRSEYDVLFEKKRKCDNATNTPFANEELCKQKICQYYDQKMACDEKQKSLEEKACSLHKSFTCSLFGECYSEKVEIYNGIVALAKEGDAGLQAEWMALQRIECLVKALGMEDTEVDAATNACKQQVFKANAVAFSYKGDAPAARSCSEVFLQPGTAIFSNQWYGGLPAHAPAESCASVCCRDTSFRPSYPQGAACPYVPGARTTTTTTGTMATTRMSTTSTTVRRVGRRGRMALR